MNKDFYQNILERQQNIETIPSNQTIASWAKRLLQLLYPQKAKKSFKDIDAIKAAFSDSKQELIEIMTGTRACDNCDHQAVAAQFFDYIPKMYNLLNKDALAILEGDPAAISEFEIIRTYPGFFAISFYRIAHKLLQLDLPLLPRTLTEYAHSKTGIDIHPGAKIGEYFFIDHGTGIVIGESSEIGNHVKLYQGVNLGALSVEKEMQSLKRHPTVEDHVVIYSGATILGGETTIGHHSIIGGNVWLVKGVPPYSKVFHKPSIEVVHQSI